MVKIGDFATVGRVSVKALRYYADIGLLCPLHIDSRTGYRYYSASQLPVLNRILVYKNLGFSLDQTRSLLEEASPADRLRELLERRQNDLARKLELEQAQLADVEARIRQIEREGRLPRYEVLLKEDPAREVVSIRRTLASYDALDPLFREMSAGIPKADIGGFGAVWHQCLYSGQEIDCQALLFLKSTARVPRGLTVERLAGSTVASVVHQDTDSDPFPDVYTAVLETADSAGLEILWPMRELYYPSGSVALGVTEIQFPVQKLQAS